MIDQLEAATVGLGLSLDERQLSQLARYLDVLQQWNAVYNLTAVRDPREMLVQHLFDCLAVVPSLRRHALEHPIERLLDVGSGGGLPGVVLAVLEPHWQVTCVDTVGKKAAFIRQTAVELGLSNLHATHARVEAMNGAFDLIVSRAFATLADFVRLSQRQLAPEGVWAAMKGKQPGEEIAKLPGDIEVFHVEHIDVPDLDAERCLVWMRRRQA